LSLLNIHLFRYCMKYLVPQYCEADGTEIFSYSSYKLANSDTAVQFWYDMMQFMLTLMGYFLLKPLKNFCISKTMLMKMFFFYLIKTSYN
jgi:hypothetical protein